MWHSFILAKYKADLNGWDYNPRISPRSSLIWKHIVAIHPFLYPHFIFILVMVAGLGSRLTVGGEIALFRWYSLGSFVFSWRKKLSPLKFSLSPNGHSWNLLFSRDLLDFEIDFMDSLFDSLENIRISPSVPNHYSWSLKSLGIFSSKSFLALLSQNFNLLPSLLVKKVWSGISLLLLKLLFG